MPNTPTLRIERLLLLAWTVTLTPMVALKFGSIPPSLAWALLPYLALVARHLIATTHRTETAPRPAPAEPSGPPAAVTNQEEVASPPDPEPDPAPARPSAPRPRRKARPRVVAEPAPAAWLEVAPGRFVRGEHPEPAPTPSEAPDAVSPGPIDQGEHPEVAPESTGGPAD